MIWSDRKSIGLTKGCIALFGAAYVAVVAACPALVRWFLEKETGVEGLTETPFLITFYVCAVPVGVILWKLWRLVGSIGEEEIFTAENIRRLRWISWMCFAVALVTLVSSFYYLFWGIAAGSMVFMGLLIRVIKNTFERAKELKDENDFTI